MVDRGGIDCSPHTGVAWKGGVHHEDVVDELIVGVVVADIVEDDEQVEEANGKQQQALGETHGHCRLLRWKGLEVRCDSCQCWLIVGWIAGHGGLGIDFLRVADVVGEFDWIPSSDCSYV